MRFLIILILALLFGCDPESDTSSENEYSDWISRETWEIESLSIASRGCSTISTFTINSVNDWIGQRVSYKEDDVDYWQTANETIEIGTGDCEDLAILSYVLYINMGYPEDMMDCFVVKLYEDNSYVGCHSVLGFYVSDYLDERILNAEGILINENCPSRKYEIIASFNRKGYSDWL